MFGRDDLAVAMVGSAADVVEGRVRDGVMLLDESLCGAIYMGVETVELSEGTTRKAVQGELLRGWFVDAHVAVCSGGECHDSCAVVSSWSKLIGTYQGGAGQPADANMFIPSWAGSHGWPDPRRFFNWHCESRSAVDGVG